MQGKIDEFVLFEIAYDESGIRRLFGLVVLTKFPVHSVNLHLKSLA